MVIILTLGKSLEYDLSAMKMFSCNDIQKLFSLSKEVKGKQIQHKYTMIQKGKNSYMFLFFTFLAHKFYSRHIKLFENDVSLMSRLESLHKLYSRSDVMACKEATEFR